MRKFLHRHAIIHRDLKVPIYCDKSCLFVICLICVNIVGQHFCRSRWAPWDRQIGHWRLWLRQTSLTQHRCQNCPWCSWFYLFCFIVFYFIFFLLTTTPFRLQDSWHQRWSSMDLSFHQLCTHTKPTVRSFYILLSLITDILFPSFSLFVRHGIIWTALPPNPLLQPQWSTGTHLFDGEEEEKSHLSFRSQNLFD